MKNQRGFTLFEVVIATAIMSSAALLLSNAWGGNRIRLRKIEINNQAAFLLDRAVAEIEVEYANRFLQIPEDDAGVFENYPNYSWTMKSQKFEMPDLRSLLVTGGDGDEFMLLIIEKMSEYFNESIKEVKVTLTYKKGKKSVKYSATTFMVDFNQPIPMPGAAAGGLPGGIPGG